MPFDPELPQTAPEPQIPPFDAALKELVKALGVAPTAQALVEGGASPREAAHAVERVATPAPTPRYAHKPEVGAGGFGLRRAGGCQQPEVGAGGFGLRRAGGCQHTGGCRIFAALLAIERAARPANFPYDFERGRLSWLSAVRATMRLTLLG
jgi:hypothetical protein